MTTARTLFSQRGYRGASLDDIAETAGYSKGAVYSNWPSKDALFLELLDREQAHAASAPQQLETTATGWALATLDFFVEAVHDPQIRSTLAERYRHARATVGADLAQGRHPPDWATWEELASVAMALGSGLIIQAAVDDTAIDPTLVGRVMHRLAPDANSHEPRPT